MSREDIEDVYELSPLQHGILAHELSSPGSRLYVVTVRVPLDDADPDLLRAAWEDVLQATPALRTSVHWEAIDKPLQVVHRHVDLPLTFGPEPPPSTTFDLGRAPLFRVDVVANAHGHELFWTYHHILLDGWSAGLVLQDLAAAARRRRQGAPPTPTTHRPFSDYLSWVQARSGDSSDRYWTEALAGVAEPTRLPAGSGAGRVTVPVLIPASIVGDLRKVAQQAGVTMATVVIGAWAWLLQRYSGERRVLFGVTVSGRGAPIEGIDEMVGMFINTVPLAAEIDGARPASAWLAQLQDRLIALREHEHTSLADVRRAARFAPGRALFESVVVFERFAGQARAAASDGEAGTDLPLSLCVAETADSITGSLTFDAARISEAFARNIPAHLRILLAALAAQPDAQQRDLVALPEDERRRLLAFNATAAPGSTATTIHDLFFAQATRTPRAAAIVAGERVCTYADLADSAARLASRLRQAGVGPESRVGLCSQRTPEMVAAMYGILAAGGAYVPLDPNYPRERITFIASDAGLTHLVGDADSLPELPQVIRHALEPVGGNAAAAPVPRRASSGPDNLAYVLYTSGSTGRPKGVALLHRGAYALMDWARTTYLDGELHGVLASTSINFDCSIFEIFAPLSWGGYIVLAGSSVEIPTIAAPHEIRLASMVPSNLLAQVRSGSLPANLRGVNLGGEASPRELIELLAAQHRALEIFHVYGPTEDTTYTTCARLHLAHGDTMPIGRPLPGTSVYLLDGEGRLVPEGCVGDVHIAGTGLARGYLDRPGLTADRFVPDHVSGAPGSRLYRTGDLGRMRADGEIELLGRRDHQVKLRGYRVELGEIEAVLGSHPDVAEAACLLRTDDDGERSLAAFVTSRPGATADATALRSWLAARLPSALVPSRIAILPDLPRNPNGKVDRRALPDPASIDVSSTVTGEPPRDRLELEVARIWEEILGLPAIARDTTFAELGGHSLQVVSILSRVLRTMGVRLPFATMLEGATVATVARAIVEQRPASPGPLVTLAGRGDGPPVFLVHAALGGVLAYDELVRNLAGISPVYAFQAPGLDDGAAPLESIEGMATQYLDEIERICSSGPAVIAGWSFGAIVAHAIAHRRRGKGSPTRLVLIDPTPPPSGDGGAPSEAALRDAFVEHLGRPGADVADPALAPIYRVFSSNMRALARHTPVRLAGDALLVTALERWQEPAAVIAAGWKAHVELLETRDTPGDHLTMMRAPHVSALADVLRELLV